MPASGDGRIWPQSAVSSGAAPVQQPSSSSIARSPSNSPRLAPFSPALPNSSRSRGNNLQNHRQKALSVSGLLSVPELVPGQPSNPIYKVPSFASSSIDIRTVHHDASSVKERPLLAPFKAFQQPSPAKASSSVPNNSYFDVDHSNNSSGVVGNSAVMGVAPSPAGSPQSHVQFGRFQSSPSLVLDDEMKRGMVPSLRRPPGKSNLFYQQQQQQQQQQQPVDAFSGSPLPTTLLRGSTLPAPPKPANNMPRITSSLSAEANIPHIMVSGDTDSDASSTASSPSVKWPASNSTHHLLSIRPEGRRHSSFAGTSNVNMLPDEWMRGHSVSSTGTAIDSKGNVSMIQSVEELQKSLGGDVVVKLDAVEEILKARMTSFQQHLAGIRSLRNRSNELLSTFKVHAAQSHSDFALYADKYRQLDFSEFDDLEKRVITARDKVDEYSQRLKVVNERISVQERDNQTRQLRYKFIRRILISVCLFLFLLVILFRNLRLNHFIVSYYNYAFPARLSPSAVSAANSSPPDDFTTILESLGKMDLNPIIAVEKTYL